VQLPQWLSSDVRFAQDPEQSVVDAGQPEPQANVPPAGAHTGVAPPHDVLHDPQWLTSDRSVSQPSPGTFEQCAYPEAHVKEQTPAVHEMPAAATCGSNVQSLSHLPQVCRSSGEAHPCVQRICVERQPPGASISPVSGRPSPANPEKASSGADAPSPSTAVPSYLADASPFPADGVPPSGAPPRLVVKSPRSDVQPTMGLARQRATTPASLPQRSIGEFTFTCA
jgi:hypothetical protein